MCRADGNTSRLQRPTWSVSEAMLLLQHVKAYNGAYIEGAETKKFVNASQANKAKQSVDNVTVHTLNALVAGQSHTFRRRI